MSNTSYSHTGTAKQSKSAAGTPAKSKPVRGWTQLRRLLPYIARCKGKVAVGLLTLAAMGIIGTLQPLAFGIIIDCLSGNAQPLGRLSRMSPAAAEFTVTRTYLDWLATLPWNVLTTEKIDINKAREVLDRDHYDLEKIKERILEFLAVLEVADVTEQFGLAETVLAGREQVALVRPNDDAIAIDGIAGNAAHGDEQHGRRGGCGNHLAHSGTPTGKM